jgi:hypothetical protein
MREREDKKGSVYASGTENWCSGGNLLTRLVNEARSNDPGSRFTEAPKVEINGRAPHHRFERGAAKNTALLKQNVGQRIYTSTVILTK